MWGGGGEGGRGGGGVVVLEHFHTVEDNHIKPWVAFTSYDPLAFHPRPSKTSC